MTLIPASHSRFAWFRSGLLGGAGRGGPLRLVGIVSVIVLAVAVAIIASMHSSRFLPQSQVAKMKRAICCRAACRARRRRMRC